MPKQDPAEKKVRRNEAMRRLATVKRRRATVTAVLYPQAQQRGQHPGRCCAAPCPGDTLRRTMGKIQTAIDKFLAAHPEVGECRIGREALNDPGLVRQIREGRSVREVTAEKVRAWMRAYARKKRRSEGAKRPADQA